MRSLLAVASLAVSLPFAFTSTADARPMLGGVSLGLDQSEADAETSDPNDTIGLFARIGLTNRISTQLELSRTETQYSDWKVRKITALLVVDLKASGNLMPFILAGVGLDESQSHYGDTANASHIEGGLGVEYRATGGVTVGIDARMGGRSIDQSEQPVLAIYAPNGLVEGEYRTARLTLGIRF